MLDSILVRGLLASISSIVFCASLCNPRAGAEPPSSSYRSISHPFEERTDYTEGGRRFGPAYMAPVIETPQGKATLFTELVNRIQCSLLLPHETWIGTAYGIKHLDTEHKTVRHYTPLDGLPSPNITSLATNGKEIFCLAASSPKQPRSLAGQAPVNKVALCQFVTSPKQGNIHSNTQVNTQAMWRSLLTLPIWIGTGEQVIRYDLSTKRIDVAQPDKQRPITRVPAYALLAVENDGKGDIAWVKSAPNLLFKADPAHNPKMIPVTIPPFPGGLEQDREQMILCALNNHVLWFTGFATANGNQRTLIGYDMSKQRWTKPAAITLGYLTEGQVMETVEGPAGPDNPEKALWFPSSSREASAYGYLASRDEWIKLPPLPPDAISPAYQVIAVNATDAWIQIDHACYHLNRHTGTWTKDRLPFSPIMMEGARSIQWGDRLVFGASSGLWILSTSTHQLTPAPRIAMESKNLRYQTEAWDESAVWFLVYGGNSQGLARFDRTHHTWQYWADDECPQRAQGYLQPNGKTCWIRTGDTLYRLNPQTSKWENISLQLGRDLKSRNKNRGSENRGSENRCFKS